MVAGLPGTGIGGCFFLLSALLMPVVELGRTVMGKSSFRRWGFVLSQSGIALGVLGAMWATGWLIGRALFEIARHHLSPAVAAALHPHNFLEAPPVIFTLLTLLVVLLGVEGLRLVFARRVPAPR